MYRFLQLQTGEKSVGLFILGDGLVDDILGKLVVAVGIGLEPVADELLVEGRLTVAGLVTFGGPETAAVGSQHLVAQNDIALFVEAELELGVGDDDAAGPCVLSALFIEGDGAVAELLGILLSLSGELLFQNLYALLEADVLVMIADLGLGAGSVDGLRELIAFPEAFGELDAADGAVLFVALPAAAGDVAADDALDGKHVELFAHHAVAVKAVLTEKLGHIGDIRADHVVGQDIPGVIEPESGHLGQDGALLCNLVLQDHVKSGDAVGRNHDQAVADIVYFADLAFLDGGVFFHCAMNSFRI